MFDDHSTTAAKAEADEQAKRPNPFIDRARQNGAAQRNGGDPEHKTKIPRQHSKLYAVSAQALIDRLTALDASPRLMNEATGNIRCRAWFAGGSDTSRISFLPRGCPGACRSLR